MALPSHLQLQIVSADRALVNERVDEVQIPGALGYLGVLPGHTPFLSTLGLGEISTRVGQQWLHLTCFWGFCEVLPDKVNVLAELGERAEDIDVGRAAEARRRAEERMKRISDEAGYNEAHARAYPELNRSILTYGLPDLVTLEAITSRQRETIAEKIQKIAEIDLWYVKQFAAFLKKLDETRDVDGKSLLYNSMILYGSGNADANRHTHSNLPLILAGSGGGTMRPGRFVKHGSKPTTNLFLSLADRVGLAGMEQFGDSTGRIEDV